MVAFFKDKGNKSPESICLDMNKFKPTVQGPEGEPPRDEEDKVSKIETSEGNLGKAMRARGYGDREVVRFQRALDKLIADFFPGQEDNEEVIRQTTIAAAQTIGMPSNAMTLEESQNMDVVNSVVKDFVYNIGRQKALLNK